MVSISKAGPICQHVAIRHWTWDPPQLMRIHCPCAAAAAPSLPLYRTRSVFIFGWRTHHPCATSPLCLLVMLSFCTYFTSIRAESNVRLPIDDVRSTVVEDVDNDGVVASPLPLDGGRSPTNNLKLWCHQVFILYRNWTMTGPRIFMFWLKKTKIYNLPLLQWTVTRNRREII